MAVRSWRPSTSKAALGSNEQTAEGNFAGWAFTGGVVQSLAAVQAPDGGVALVAIGLDNAVWVDEQSFTASEADFGTIDGSWSGFSSLGGNARLDDCPQQRLRHA